jgi:hypothetical protein
MGMEYTDSINEVALVAKLQEKFYTRKEKINLALEYGQ